MSFRYRLLAVSSLLAIGAATPLLAQRISPKSRPEATRLKRPAYGYFRYRVPSLSMRLAPKLRLEGQLRRGALERALDRRALDRSFARRVLDQSRERRLALQDRAWRRQLEFRDRAMNRLQDRLDRIRERTFEFRRRSRTI